MGIGLYFISNSQLDNIMMLTFMLLVGGLTYVGILVVLKDSVSKIIQKTISQYFEKKKYCDVLVLVTVIISVQ